MPFAVFRQHQRKLIAFLAIMAMVSFVLSDTIPRWLNGGGVSNNDYVVGKLFDRPVRRSDLNTMDAHRRTANYFMSLIDPRIGPSFFGGLTEPDLIDAMILEHEADRLSIPETPAFAQKWIQTTTASVGMSMTQGYFEDLRRRIDRDMSGEQLLITLAGQIRIRMAQQGIAVPLVTPLDVYKNYRDQIETSSYKVVPFPVDAFTDAVPNPTEAELRELYEKGKDRIAGPADASPGFKVPRQIKVEYVSLNFDDLVRQIRASLPESEVAAYYDTRRKNHPMDVGLPNDLFLGEPNLTPPRYVPFSEMREPMTDALAREKAKEQVEDLFAKVRAGSIDRYADAYENAQDQIEDARKDGQSTDKIAIPKFEDLSKVAQQNKLVHEVSSLMDVDQARTFGRIGSARVGSEARGARDVADFASKMFDPKTKIFEGVEMSDILGDRFLARKIADEPAHVAPLDQVKDQVVRAWKIEKARPLARKAADALAEKARSSEGTIKDVTVDGRPVVNVDSVTRLRIGSPIPSQFGGQLSFQRTPPTPSDIRQIPDAGPKLLDSLFTLKKGEVSVEPDRPERTFYVLMLEKRDALPMAALMGPTGSLADFWIETRTQVMSKGFDDGMARLRASAGYEETRIGEALEGGNAADSGA